MGHPHEFHDFDDHNHDSIKNIGFAFFLNLSFAIVELFGGIFTNSLAIFSDALHDFGDSISLGLSWYLEKVSKRDRTISYTFGYRRFSILGALISSVILVGGSVYILTEAVPRLFNPVKVHVKGMFLLAAVGVLVNGLAVWRLRKGKKLSEKVVRLHLLEDVLGWMAVLLASIVMLYVEVFAIDTILSILISLFLLWRVTKNIKQIMKIFLQSVPGDVSVKEIEKNLLLLNPVKDVHDIHLWSLDGDYHVLTVHVVVDSDTSKSDYVIIKNQCRALLKETRIHHATIEIESENETCLMTTC